MADNVVTLGIRTVMDISDVKANIGVLQSQFNKLKLPAGITDKFNQEISKFSATYEKYQQKMAQGIKTKGDATQTSKYLNEIAREYDNIVKTYSKASGMDLKSMFKIDSGPLKDAAAEIERLTKQLASVDINKTGFQDLGQQLSGILKNSKFSGEHGLINEMVGSFSRGEVDKAKQALQEIQKEVEKRQYVTAKKTVDGKEITYQKPGTYSKANTDAALGLINQMIAAADQAETKIQGIQNPLNQASKRFDELLNKGVISFRGVGDAAEKEKTAVHGVVEENKNLVNSMASAQQQSQMLTNRIAMYFSLYEIIRKIGDVARSAFQTVKELDASMTETAVVTNFSVGDMWDQLPRYTATANQLGSTIKDVYDATTLYYQQGLNTNQAMGVATETLKMARIGGLEAAEATDMMTAALRGFNMQINELSAQRINDVYSKLAAITASNTEELGSAMTRTASIASSAGMEFETTSAFLAQMIETTREAPENLGTAMKTIVARFQEMKKAPGELISSEGELLDANRVEKALKTIGVALRDTNGDFRNLDQVFLEISAKWDTLSMGQQRYIATMAAGSRQQSRFIAMMSDYDRTMELVDAANSSAGASQEQFNKTLDSMNTKLNKLKNAWDQFAMGLTNSSILKGGIDALTGGITIINKFIDAVGKISPEPFKNINKSLLTLVGTLGALRLGGSLFSKHGGLLSGLLQGAAGFFQGKSFGEIGQEVSKSFNNPELIATVQASSGEVSKSFYQGLYNNIKAEKGKIGQAISESMQDPHYLSTVNLSDYLQLDSVSLADKGSAIIGALKTGLDSNHELSDTMKQKAEHALKAMEEKFASGRASIEQMLNKADGFAKKYNFQLDPKTIGVEQVNKSLLETGNILTTTGAKLQRFGNMLQNTPLEPFGKLLTIAGTALTSIGMTLTMIKAGIIKTTVSLAADTVAWLINTKAIDADTEALAKNNAVRIGKDGQIKEIKNAGQFLKNFAAQGGSVGTVLKGLAGKLTGVLGKLAGFAPQIIGIALAIASLHSAWKLLNWRTDQLKAAKTRAADAADQFSNVKQEISELKDKLDELGEIDSAFDNLVSGTAEFNEKISESNALVTELINKYPMLNDSKYLSTDKNGRLILNAQGREEVQKELKQRQGNAQALSLMAAQDVKNFNSQGWLKEYDKARNKENANLARYGTRNRRIAQKENISNMQSRGEQSSKDLLKAQQDEIISNYKTSINALFTGFNTKDLINRDKVAQIFGESYATILEKTQADTKKEDRAKAYARAYGYDEYLGGNKFRKGNEEVEIEKDIWNDETTNKRIKANEQIVDSAVVVDNTLSELDGKISTIFDDVKIESDSLVTDILSSNIETNRNDLKALVEKNDLGKLVNNLTDQQKEALKAAGINDIEAVMKERIEAIRQAQSQQDTELASMMARATGKTADWLTSGTRGAGEQLKSLKNQLDGLNDAQRAFLNTVGKGIEDTFGSSSMSSFMNTYLKGGEKTQKRLEQITKNVDWTSSISSLGAVNKMLNSTNTEIQQCGESIRQSVNGSHLLNDAMQEMFASEDWQKLTENMDTYVNTAGQLDASSIQKMAQESSTLNSMLSTGALTAGELASAINVTSINGVADITDLSDAVIKLIGYFGHLDDAVLSAHNYIENFDEGIDFGEGEDFLKNNIEKIKEYLNPESGRIQWGNEQLHNYIQSIIGPEAWQNAVDSADGNYKEAIKAVQKQVESFNKGYDQIFNNLGNGKTSTGKKIDFNKINKDLFGTAKNGISFTDQGNGALELKLNSHSVKDLNQFLQKAEGIGEDQANMMIEYWRAISGDFDKQVRQQSFEAGLKDTSFAQDKTIRYQNARGEGQEAIVLSKSELKALTSVNEGKNQHETKQQIADATGKNVITFQNMKNGEFRNDYAQMMKEWNEALYGENTRKQFLNRAQFKNEDNTAIALEKLVSQYNASIGNQEQAMGMAYEAAKANENKQYEYNGRIIDMTQIHSLQEFLEEVSKIDENVHWVSIGEAIAQGFLNYHKENEKKSSGEYTGATTEKSVKENKTRQGKVPEGTTIPGVGFVPKKSGRTSEGATIPNQGSFWGWIKKTFGKSSETKKDNVFEETAEKNKESADTLAIDIDKLGTSIGKAEGKVSTFSKTLEILSGTNNTTPKKQSDSKDSTLTIKPKVEGLDEKAQKIFVDETFTKTIKVEDKQVEQAENKVDSLKQKTKKGSTLKVSAKIHEAKINNQKSKVDYTTGKIAKVENAKATVDYTKVGKQAEPKNKNAKVNYDLGTQEDPDNRNITLWATIKDKKTGKTIGANGVARGKNQNYHLPTSPNFGSLATGNRKPKHLGAGSIGPNNNGGLTLTGELGYEVAWLPSQGKSMILGANGPEMLNLPKDAVVWNHEQSKEIIKKKSIPSGTAAIGAGSMVGGGDDGSHADPYPDNTKPKKTGKKTPKKTNQTNKENKKNSKKTGKAVNQWIKWAGKVGKITNWWENISRKVEGAQRIVDKNQKDFEKVLKAVGTTLSSIQGSIDKYQKSLETSIKVNQEIYDHYTTRLENFDKNGGSKTKINKYNTTSEKASQLKASIDAAGSKGKVKYGGKTISVKSARKKLKQLNNTAKKQKKNAVAPEGVSTVTWDDTAIVKKGGKKKKQKVKRKAAIDFSKIVYFDPETGAYVADTDKINNTAKIKKGKNKGKVNKKEAQAIQKKANEYIDTATQRRNAAEDKINAAREALNKLADDTYNMFNRWEKSLTETYLISKKLEALQKKSDIYDAQKEYITARTSAGYHTEESFDQLQKVLIDKQNNLVEQLHANVDNIEASFSAYQKSLNFQEYIDNFLVPNSKGINGESETANNDIKAATIVFDLMKEYGLNSIDTFDPGKIKELYKQYAENEYNNETDTAVQKVIDRIAENQGNYLDAIQESYGTLTEVYNTLNEYEEYINEFEESLLNGLEEEINKEIDKQEKLNSALTDAFKDLMDEVKRRLDQRREAEDNAKTESDISRKQQRLAVLRADTSGGHASEIRQLEQEIADAQQQYGRTLEDQLLNRLQEQGDEAAKQRERQIKLLEIQRDLAQALGTNLEEVKRLLENPEGNYEQIRQLWLANHNYDEALPKEQEKLEKDWLNAWDEYRASGIASEELREVLKSNKLNLPADYQTAVQDGIKNIYDLLKGYINKGVPEVEIKTDSDFDLSTAKEKGINAETAYYLAHQKDKNITYEDIRKAGYNAEDFKAAGISANEALGAGFEHDELKKGGYGAIDYKSGGVEYKDAKNVFATEELAAGNYTEAQGLLDAITKIKAAAKNSVTYHDNYLKNQAKLDKGGLTKTQKKTYIARRDNWEAKWEAVREEIKTLKDTINDYGIVGKRVKEVKNGTVTFYKTGGLATETGPAWLDGTCAKPELVLNATDTKNFIALKDVLSSVMNGVNSMTDVSDIQGAPVTYDININVDHLNNDYDVDRVADRVKKIIVKDASYRNVTAVRKFR